MARKYSEETRRLNRERYYWLKEHHICVDCAQNEAFHKFVRCPECLDKKKEIYYKNQKQGYATARLRIAKLKAEGKCISCTKPRSEKSVNFCDKCLEQRRRYKRLWEREKRAGTQLSEEERHRRFVENGKRNHHFAVESENFKKAHERTKHIINGEIKIHLGKKIV